METEEYRGQFCSNFDGWINTKVTEELKNGGWAEYCAWDWHGEVWYEKGKYYCRRSCYGVRLDTLYAETAEELRDLCRESWGYN